MKQLLFVVALVFVSKQTWAENYDCQILDGPSAGYGTVTIAPDMPTAIENIKKAQGTTQVSCEILVPHEFGTAADLPGKKWGFQGIVSNQTYLVFENNQLLHVQECGNQKKIYRFSMVAVDGKSFKLSPIGTEGECNPSFIPLVKRDCIVTFDIGHQVGKPYAMLIHAKNPEEGLASTSFYLEMN